MISSVLGVLCNEAPRHSEDLEGASILRVAVAWHSRPREHERPREEKRDPRSNSKETARDAAAGASLPRGAELGLRPGGVGSRNMTLLRSNLSR